jgi:hypothetical protein
VERLSLAEMVAAVQQAMASGRRIAAGLTLIEIKRRNDDENGGRESGEQTWQAFVARHFPGQDTGPPKLLGRVTYRGGTHRCSSCGIELTSRCDCVAPYIATGPGAKPAPEQRDKINDAKNYRPAWPKAAR